MSNERKTINDLIERSSLGEPGARKLRIRTPRAVAESMVDAVENGNGRGFPTTRRHMSSSNNKSDGPVEPAVDEEEHDDADVRY